MKKAVILLSGGLDSATCLAQAVHEGYQCYAISFDYGQRHRAELDAAKRIAQHFQVSSHKTVALSIGELGGSALTDHKQTIPEAQSDDTIPSTYVPARNTTFLSIALGWAEILTADAIFIGVSAVDYSGYPDCRPEYIQAFQTMANLATRTGIEGTPIKIVTPLINLNKAQTIQLGHSLQLDYRHTVSCYQATHAGHACGLCDSCFLRKKGFEEALLPDPTCYA